MQPVVSIIVPVYNVELYVAKCIQSIINQTFDNFECLVIDDGSPDRSIEIVQKLIKQDTRFRVITQLNQGLGMARNTGLDHAQGEYVCFVDSDDYIDPHYLQKTYDRCRNDQADICSFGYQRVDGKDNPIHKARIPVLENTQNNNELIKDLFVDKNHFSTAWSALYKRALFDGIRFPKGVYEDTPTITLVLLKNRGIRVQMIDDILYFYVWRKGSIINSIDLQKSYDLLRAFENIQNNLQLYDIEKDLKKAFLVYSLNMIVPQTPVILKHSKNYNADIIYLANYLKLNMIICALIKLYFLYFLKIRKLKRKNGLSHIFYYWKDQHWFTYYGVLFNGLAKIY